MEKLETYRGVILYRGQDKNFPVNALGVVWAAKDTGAMERYIDNALDGGNQMVNIRGALVFKGIK